MASAWDPMKKLHIIKVLRNWFQGGLLWPILKFVWPPQRLVFSITITIYLSFYYIFLPTCLCLPTYINILTYLWQPSNINQPMSTYLPLPNYINTPIYLYQHTYLPISTHLPTYVFLSTHTNPCEPTYLYQSLNINVWFVLNHGSSPQSGYSLL